MDLTSSNEDMELGISRLLGFSQYPDYPASPECNHESDGYEYNEDSNSIKSILRCEKCGIYYEVLRIK